MLGLQKFKEHHMKTLSANNNLFNSLQKATITASVSILFGLFSAHSHGAVIAVADSGVDVKHEKP